jgi:hypothetical protein
MTFVELVKFFGPELVDDMADTILWSATPFPFVGLRDLVPAIRRAVRVWRRGWLTDYVDHGWDQYAHPRWFPPPIRKGEPA